MPVRFTPNRTVRVEFRTKTGSYRLIKSVKSATGGYVTTTVTAGSDGYWRLRYVGSATTGASAAKGDFVDVR